MVKHDKVADPIIFCSSAAVGILTFVDVVGETKTSICVFAYKEIK